MGFSWRVAVIGVLSVGLGGGQAIANDLSQPIAEPGLSVGTPAARTLADSPGGLVPLTAQAPSETANASNPPAFTPRAGLRYTGESAGSEGFSSLEAFIPVLQIPGSSLTFVAPRFNVYNSGRFGSNLTIGHRFLDSGTGLVFGGSVSYDNRDAGSFVSHQIGFGLEALAASWDVRVNGYVPVGSDRQFLSESLQGVNRIQGTNLLLNRLARFDAAMSGFDLEAGAILLPSETGYLRPYLGTYVYSAAQSAGAWGIRAGATYQSDIYNANVAVQHDGLFGTRALFSIGVNLPGGAPRGPSRPDALLARMGETVVRQNSIAIENQTIRDTVVATNPATGQPWQFRSVVFGSAPTELTTATTYATIQEALAAATAGPNEVVYVYTQPGIAQPQLRPFTIPDSVRVLSSAPALQPLAVSSVNGPQQVQLPANTGVFPRVTVPLGQTIAGGNGRAQGLITLGNNTTLSGFEAFFPIGYLASIGGNPADNLPGIHGIRAVGVGNFSIENNRVVNAFAEGIYLENASGTVRVLRNTVVNTFANTNPAASFSDFNSGIFVYQNRGTVDLTIANNTVTADAAVVGIPYAVDGIEFNICRDLTGQPFVPCTAPAFANVRITDNVITMTGAFDINSGADGIDTNAGSLGRANFLITNNVIQAADNGITFDAETNAAGQNSAQVTFRIEGNRITTNPGGGQRRDGIDLDFQGSSVGDVIIANNTMTVAERGLDIETSGTARLRITAEGNTITTAGANAVRLRGANAAGSTSLVDAFFINNTGNGTLTSAINNTGSLCILLQGNRFTAITLTRAAGATLQVDANGTNTPNPTLPAGATTVSGACARPTVP